MWLEARLFGIPTVDLISNGNHHHFCFSLHDVLVTDSRATAALYRESEGLDVRPCGIFIKPSHAKSAAVVARLILMANNERHSLLDR